MVKNSKSELEKYISHLKKESYKKKGTKKPNKMSAYIIFCKEERKKLNKDLGAKETMKELANRWKNIKDDEKKVEKFNKIAEEQYQKALENFEEVVIDGDIL